MIYISASFFCDGCKDCCGCFIFKFALFLSVSTVGFRFSVSPEVKIKKQIKKIYCLYIHIMLLRLDDNIPNVEFTSSSSSSSSSDKITNLYTYAGNQWLMIVTHKKYLHPSFATVRVDLLLASLSLSLSLSIPHFNHHHQDQSKKKKNSSTIFFQEIYELSKMYKEFKKRKTRVLVIVPDKNSNRLRLIKDMALLFEDPPMIPFEM